jgi:hypothetical protein
MSKNVIEKNLEAAKEAKEAKAAAKKAQADEKKYDAVRGTATLLSTVQSIKRKNGRRVVTVAGVEVGIAISDADADAMLLMLHEYATKDEPLTTPDAVFYAMQRMHSMMLTGQQMADANFVPDFSFTLASGCEILVKGKTAYDNLACEITNANDYTSKLSQKDLTKILKERVEAVLSGIRDSGDDEDEEEDE